MFYCWLLVKDSRCYEDSNCAGSNGCGRVYYGTDTTKEECCNDDSVTKMRLESKDYCRNLPDGTSCAKNAMCTNGEYAGSLECGKNVCCKDVFVPDYWISKSDLCIQTNEGDRCPTTEDEVCAKIMQHRGDNIFLSGAEGGLHHNFVDIIYHTILTKVFDELMDD